jgi:hypothetical protein
MITSRLMDNMSSLTSGLAGLAVGGSSAATTVNVPASEKLKLLKASGNNSVCYVCNQSNVWCLIPFKINEQLDYVLRYKTYELGINLIGSQNFFNVNNPVYAN